MSTGPTKVDVMIVGGGPAGLSTWLHLRALAPELAASTILVERASYPREKLCGGAITPLGWELLSGLGLALDVPVVAVDAIALRFGPEPLVVRCPGLLKVVHRAAFDHALATAAVGRGLRLQPGEEFNGMVPLDNGLLVETSARSYEVKVLVGADGASSAVRRAMRAPQTSHLARVVEAVAPIDANRHGEFVSRVAVFDFAPVTHGLQGYAWHFPCWRDGVASVNHGIYDARLDANRPRADITELFSQALADFDSVASPPVMGAPLRWLADDSVLSQPRVLLVGDAAGVDVVLGEGIAQSLDYGDLAANVLIEAFASSDFSFRDYAERLREHPLGHQLYSRARLARAIYDEHVSLDDIRRHVLRWMSAAS